MSSIPPNIVGSIFQAQISANETSKNEDSQKNQKARESRERNRLADQQQSEVENTSQTEDVIIRRQDEKEHNGQDARETYDQHNKNETNQLYSPDAKIAEPDQKNNDEHPPTDHIDLSA